MLSQTTNCSRLLLEHLRSWQKTVSPPAYEKDFAAHLGIHEITFNRLKNNAKTPSIKMLVYLSKRLQDQRFLELALQNTKQ